MRETKLHVHETKPAVRILQLTDLHLFGAKNQKFLGVSPYEHLSCIINKIKENKDDRFATMVLLTGDISQDYTKASYKLAFEVVSELHIPILAFAGNHDDVNTLHQVFAERRMDFNKSIAFDDCDNWQVILLNSHWSEHVAGLLAKGELDFLRFELAKNRHKKIIIFLHHHILPVGAPWLDKSQLTNTKDFFEVIKGYANIEAVISGHVHQEFEAENEGINFYATPAIVWQFMPHSSVFKLADKMPGYRVIDLFSDGKYETRVIRLDYDKKFVPDLSSKGY